VVATGARRVTDEMLAAAARALAGLVSEKDLAAGTVYPPLTDIRKASHAIATAVGQVAYDQGLAATPEPEDLPSFIRECMHRPEYEHYV
jgi:malate dehydrogenase (oxaloacetate-decarboxylating)(NADP+)